VNQLLKTAQKSSIPKIFRVVGVQM